MSIILWGQYPRSEYLVQATRDWDRQRIDDDQLLKIQRYDREMLLELQKGFPYLSTGQFQWEDLIRPLAHLSPTLSTGALTRFFETNTFWRQIEGFGEIDPRKINPWIDTYFPDQKKDQTVFTFPFVHLLHRFSTNLVFEQLFPVFEKLPKGIIVFFEPYLGWESIPSAEKKQARQLMQTVKDTVNSPILLITSFHNINKELDDLYQLPVDGFGIDFYHNTIEEALPSFPKDKWLVAGILDTDSTSIESPEAIQSFRTQAEHYLDRNQIFYSHSGPAELIPREVMDEKVRNLQEALA